MKVNDPKKKIIMPGGTSDIDMAIRQSDAEAAFKANPFYKMYESLRGQLAQVMAQQQVLLVRIQSLTDYMAQSGLLLHQDITDGGIATGEPHTPDETRTKLFEALVEADMIEMPEYGYTPFFVEYSIRTKFVTNLLAQKEKEAITFLDVVDHIRYFNNEEGRLAPINGAEFGLPQYLAMNPDNLSDEKLLELGAEFGLQRMEEPGDEVKEVVVEPPQAETEELSVDETVDAAEPKA